MMVTYQTQMEDETSEITHLVHDTIHVLKRISDALTKSDDKSKLDETAQQLEQSVTKLRELVEEIGKQRVVVLVAAHRVMEDGVLLYNSARATYREMQSSDAFSVDRLHLQYHLLVARYTATRVMNIALTFSKGGDFLGKPNTIVGDQWMYVDECIDVLRSYGRVGTLLLDNAATDSDRCVTYLTLAKEALDSASTMWMRIGLSCLTRCKEGNELDEILQDLWDFSLDRIRAIKLLNTSGVNGENNAIASVLETLHELQMLLPYMTTNVKVLLSLLTELSDGCRERGHHDEQEALFNESLRMCESFEGSQEMMDDEMLATFKRHIIMNMIESLRLVGELDKAESCFSLLGQTPSPDALLTMLKLYLEKQANEKALSVLRCLFHQNDIISSMTGARLYAQALNFRDEALLVYDELQRNYGDSTFEINLELACALAGCEKEERRQQSIDELKRMGDYINDFIRDKDKNEMVPMVKHLNRIQQTVFDATQAAFNSNLLEHCMEWASAGIYLSPTPSEASVYMRIIAVVSLKLDRHADARKWAQEAVSSDFSKKSLLILFQVTLSSHDTTSNDMIGIVSELQKRDDFEAQDLVSFGSAANTAKKSDVTLHILDQLCQCVCDGQAVPSLPIGVLLQNTAQLAYNTLIQKDSRTDGGDQSALCNVEKFVEYADKFLVACSDISPKNVETTFGPPSIFLWFYSMSFNIARSCSRTDLFVMGADIAKYANQVFVDAPPLLNRESDCLLAAISSAMISFDKLDSSQLRSLLNVITRYESIQNKEIDINNQRYLAKCVLIIKVRLFDPDIDTLFQFSQNHLGRDVGEFIELGEQVLYASKFDDAHSVRHKYRELAAKVFRYGLQLMLQSNNINGETLSYLFRRLITVAQTKSNALEWFDQLSQVLDSLEVSLPEIDAEWVIGRAWNIGVQLHRSDDWDESQKFMKAAIHLADKLGPNLQGLSSELHKQYQTVIGFRSQSRSLADSNRLPIVDRIEP